MPLFASDFSDSLLNLSLGKLDEWEMSVDLQILLGIHNKEQLDSFEVLPPYHNVAEEDNVAGQSLNNSLHGVEVIDAVESLVVALVGNDNAVDKYVVVNDDLVLDNYIHIDIVDVVDIHNWVEVVVVD